MVVSQMENLRIRVAKEINKSLAEFCKRKVIKKQDTIEGLLRWFLAQDEMLQSIIVGQIKDPEYQRDIATLVLARLAFESNDDERLLRFKTTLLAGSDPNILPRLGPPPEQPPDPGPSQKKKPK